jgi:shikimate dehydrogenase
MIYGLLGKKLGHSFSPDYFRQKFAQLGLADSHTYQLFEIADIAQVLPILARQDIAGLNVTIPYKQAIMPYLAGIDAAAAKVGAVNTLYRANDGSWWGYNTDVIGFGLSLDQKIAEIALSTDFVLSDALILGTGGAAKAVQYALKARKINYLSVSRQPKDGDISYLDCNADRIQQVQLIVQTTPLGMYPNIDTCPDIDYAALNPKHLLFDLVYNPKETVFLQRGEQAGAYRLGGEQMLQLQADAAWQIWQQQQL